MLCCHCGDWESTRKHLDSGLHYNQDDLQSTHGTLVFTTGVTRRAQLHAVTKSSFIKQIYMSVCLPKHGLVCKSRVWTVCVCLCVWPEADGLEVQSMD